jgi:hypothetical protein
MKLKFIKSIKIILFILFHYFLNISFLLAEECYEYNDNEKDNFLWLDENSIIKLNKDSRRYQIDQLSPDFGIGKGDEIKHVIGNHIIDGNRIAHNFCQKKIRNSEVVSCNANKIEYEKNFEEDRGLTHVDFKIKKYYFEKICCEENDIDGAKRNDCLSSSNSIRDLKAALNPGVNLRSDAFCAGTTQSLRSFSEKYVLPIFDCAKKSIMDNTCQVLMSEGLPMLLGMATNPGQANSALSQLTRSIMVRSAADIARETARKMAQNTNEEEATKTGNKLDLNVGTDLNYFLDEIGKKLNKSDFREEEKIRITTLLEKAKTEAIKIDSNHREKFNTLFSSIVNSYFNSPTNQNQAQPALNVPMVREALKTFKPSHVNLEILETPEFAGIKPHISELLKILDIPHEAKVLDVEVVKKRCEEMIDRVPKRKEELIKMANELVDLSQQPIQKARKSFKYVLGPPGNGKTSSIKLIAECAGLPICVFSEEHFKENKSNNKSLAFVLEKMITSCLKDTFKDKDGKKITNGVILIDDIDEILNSISSENKEKQEKEFFSTLKRLSDSQYQTFNNPEAKDGDFPFNIGRVTFYATGNSLPKQLDGTDNYEGVGKNPLMTRIPVINFKIPDKEERAYFVNTSMKEFEKTSECKKTIDEIINFDTEKFDVVGGNIGIRGLEEIIRQFKAHIATTGKCDQFHVVEVGEGIGDYKKSVQAHQEKQQFESEYSLFQQKNRLVIDNIQRLDKKSYYHELFNEFSNEADSKEMNLPDRKFALIKLQALLSDSHYNTINMLDPEVLRDKFDDTFQHISQDVSHAQLDRLTNEIALRSLAADDPNLTDENENKKGVFFTITESNYAGFKNVEDLASIFDAHYCRINNFGELEKYRQNKMPTSWMTYRTEKIHQTHEFNNGEKNASVKNGNAYPAISGLLLANNEINHHGDTKNEGRRSNGRKDMSEYQYDETKKIYTKTYYRGLSTQHFVYNPSNGSDVELTSEQFKEELPNLEDVAIEYCLNDLKNKNKESNKEIKRIFIILEEPYKGNYPGTKKPATVHDVSSFVESINSVLRMKYYTSSRVPFLNVNNITVLVNNSREQFDQLKKINGDLIKDQPTLTLTTLSLEARSSYIDSYVTKVLNDLRDEATNPNKNKYQLKEENLLILNYIKEIDQTSAIKLDNQLRLDFLQKIIDDFVLAEFHALKRSFMKPSTKHGNSDHDLRIKNIKDKISKQYNEHVESELDKKQQMEKSKNPKKTNVDSQAPSAAAAAAAAEGGIEGGETSSSGLLYRPVSPKNNPRNQSPPKPNSGKRRDSHKPSASPIENGFGNHHRTQSGIQVD